MMTFSPDLLSDGYWFESSRRSRCPGSSGTWGFSFIPEPVRGRSGVGSGVKERGYRASSAVRVRAPGEARRRCAHNADHFAHDTPLSAFFAEVVCTLGATPPRTVTSPPPNGGIVL